jgi:hypothetical protein
MLSGSLLRKIKRRRKRRPKAWRPPPLTIEQILTWADEHQSKARTARHGTRSTWRLLWVVAAYLAAVPWLASSLSIVDAAIPGICRPTPSNKSSIGRILGIAASELGRKQQTDRYLMRQVKLGPPSTRLSPGVYADYSAVTR